MPQAEGAAGAGGRWCSGSDMSLPSRRGWEHVWEP